jgi:hypothetical protein
MVAQIYEREAKCKLEGTEEEILHHSSVRHVADQMTCGIRNRRISMRTGICTGELR